MNNKKRRFVIGRKSVLYHAFYTTYISTRETLAQDAGVSITTLNKAFNERPVRINTLQKICEKLGVDYADAKKEDYFG